MQTLHKPDDEGIRYWSIWQEGKKLGQLSGKVGESQVQFTSLDSHDEFDRIAARLRSEKMREGFIELNSTEYKRLSIQFYLDDFDLYNSENINELIGAVLGWTGNGFCEGYDYDNLSINFNCQVINVERAVQHLEEELGSANFHNYNISSSGGQGKQVSYSKHFFG